MTHEEIKRHRVESTLKEIIPEALGSLDDPLIQNVVVTDVVCSRGRSNARVFLDLGVYTKEEKKEIIQKLYKLSGYLQTHCKQTEGWFKAPIMTCEFDTQPEQIRKIESLFKKMREEMGDSDEK
jgi:ribosome-binding factor A